jgi:hypothetical protein
MSDKDKKIGDHGYRESYGRYFEDFDIGDVYEHRPGRTITEPAAKPRDWLQRRNPPTHEKRWVLLS